VLVELDTDLADMARLLVAQQIAGAECPLAAPRPTFRDGGPAAGIVVGIWTISTARSIVADHIDGLEITTMRFVSCRQTDYAKVCLGSSTADFEAYRISGINPLA
jgi:hypothetical protein